MSARRTKVLGVVTLLFLIHRHRLLAFHALDDFFRRLENGGRTLCASATVTSRDKRAGQTAGRRESRRDLMFRRAS